MVLLQASEGCSSKAVSLETDMAKGIFGKAGMESEPTKVEKLQLLPCTRLMLTALSVMHLLKLYILDGLWFKISNFSLIN